MENNFKRLKNKPKSGMIVPRKKGIKNAEDKFAGYRV
jgi:hypothetical protein